MNSYARRQHRNIHTINKIYDTSDCKTVQRNYSSTDIANEFLISPLILISEHFDDSTPSIPSTHSVIHSFIHSLTHSFSKAILDTIKALYTNRDNDNKTTLSDNKKTLGNLLGRPKLTCSATAAATTR